MTRLRVIFAGPHVTVQDKGRPGLMRFGVPASGPMDRKSFAVAQTTIGATGAAIEVSLGGLTLEAVEGAVTLAIVGGGFIVERGAGRFGAWQVLTLTAGERLVIRPGPWGSWTYIAFAGALQAPEWLGSQSTHGPSGLGGGRLHSGQELTIAAPRVLSNPHFPIQCPVWARPRSVLHAVPGPQDRYFSPDTLAALGSETFTLTDAYDRMGVRLSGPSLTPEAALAIPSEPILRGSVQVAGDGVATVLLADHQTTGGYPKIATILSDDLDGFVQRRPHDAVRFHLITPENAVVLARQRAQSFSAYLGRIKP